MPPSQSSEPDKIHGMAKMTTNVNASLIPCNDDLQAEIIPLDAQIERQHEQTVPGIKIRFGRTDAGNEGSTNLVASPSKTNTNDDGQASLQNDSSDREAVSSCISMW